MSTTDRYWQTARGPGADGQPLLTPKQLEALELHLAHGMSLRGVAAYLGVSFETVRDRIRRAGQKVELAQRQAYFRDNPDIDEPEAA